MKEILLNRQLLKPRKGRKYAEVVWFGDWHRGSPQADNNRAEGMLNYCLKNGIYVFLMGDLIENANRYSVGAGVYEQIMTPQQQYEEVEDILRPLADKGLLIGNIRGNHEFRTYQETGVDITKMLSRTLDIPYLGDAGWSIFRVGKENYTIYTLHGASGAKFEWTKLKSLADISHSFNADLLCEGHVHACIDASQLVQMIDIRNKTVVERKKHLLITGHYLRYSGGYAQMKGFPLSKLGSPKVKFFSDKHDIHTSW